MPAPSASFVPSRNPPAGFYAPLWCKSNFSFLEGASDPAELIEQAYHLGLRSIAIVDRDGVHGIVQAHVRAQELGIHLIVGSQITLLDNSIIVLLAQNRDGYANLCGLVTKGRLRSAKGESRVTWREVGEHAEGLIALWGGERSLLVSTPAASVLHTETGLGATPALEAEAAEQDSNLAAASDDPHRIPLRLVPPGTPRDRQEQIPENVLDFPLRRARDIRPEPDTLDDIANSLKKHFGDRLYAVIARHHRACEIVQERTVRRRAERFGLPLVAATEVLYHLPSRRDTHDVLACIREGKKLSEAGRVIRGNSEHALHAPRSFEALYSDIPAAVSRSLEIAERCTFSMSEIRYRYPSERLPDGTTSNQWMRHLTYEGAKRRYGIRSFFPPLQDPATWRGELTTDDDPDLTRVPAAVRAQLAKELSLIEELDYSGYFLTMREIVRFCQEQNILCQGRGSAANSIVCYCLEITAIDPVQMNLLFERFISKERAEPPDIDLDIEHNRREEAIQHMYAKYGRDHAAMVANVIRYRPKSAVRDVGKVLGLSETTLDRLSKMIGRWGGLDDEPLAKAGLDPRHPIQQHLLRISNEIIGFPRHLSIHPGGFLLGHVPVSELVPIENATMANRTVIQWDKDDIESLGLFKVDLLGLGALTHLHHAFDLIREHRGVSVDMASIPADDPDTFDSMCRADTVGVFQIESRAQMSMLPRLKPRTFYDLVVQISIVRPGPITGGMVHPYLRRREGKEPIDYPHDCLIPVLEKTLGIPLFQEQVMKLAIVAADYTPGEADQLRRDMAAWKKTGRLERHHERLTSRMIAKGIEPDFAERVFSQIKGFGDYGFPESHAASFALIALASTWLKCHYPAEFTCGILNALPMGFYSAATIVDDAKRHGVEVRPVNVLASHWNCTLESSVVDPVAELSGRTIHRVIGSGSANEATPSLPPRRYVAAPDTVQPDPTPRISPARGLAVRMGLRFLKGVHEADGKRIEQAAAERPFSSIRDFTGRTRISKGALSLLAEAGAFEGLAMENPLVPSAIPHRNRRSALWAVEGIVNENAAELERLDHVAAPIGSGSGSGPSDACRSASMTADSAQATASSPPSDFYDPEFEALDPLERITWDYRTTSHSVRGHILEPMRDQMRALGLPDARTVRNMRNGSRARYAGVVICRQRPGTASGVVFMTLEDETGFVNAVLWPKVFERYSVLAQATSFLGISGKVQSQDSVVHIIVDKMWEPAVTLGFERQSRDFH